MKMFLLLFSIVSFVKIMYPVFNPECTLDNLHVVNTTILDSAQGGWLRTDIQMFVQSRNKGNTVFSPGKKRFHPIYLFLLIIMNSNDVQMNPGPSCVGAGNGSTVYPCGTCEQPVTWDDRAVMCETCEQWYHIGCQNIHTRTYIELVENSNIVWDCIVCDNPNYSSVCFDYVLSTTNQFSVLSDTPLESPLPDRSIKPVHTSTPDRSKYKTTRKNTPLKVLNVNFQSIKSKQCRLKNLIESSQPDIILGTETWLDPSVTDNQIFPSNYKLYRNDRPTKGGGVLIAINKTLLSSPVPELQTDCEITWAKIEVAGYKDLYVCSYYNPKTSNIKSLDELEKSLNKACKLSTSFIMVGGDFNFPGWNWKSKTLKPNTAYTDLHYRFGDILDDNGLYQLVEEPTRENSTFDLILTNNPTRFPQVDIIPGVSDHDIVYTEVEISPIKHKQQPRKILLYKRANWNTLKDEMNKCLIDITNSSAGVNDLWNLFKNSLEKGINAHIPHKVAKEKDSLPWISPELKKLIRKRDKYYKTMKKSANTEHKARFKDLKRMVQRQLRRAYWSYIENIVTPVDEKGANNSMKRFWTYIKHKKTDSSGISPLKRDGILHSDPLDKATILNEQFQSAFSQKSNISLSEFESQDFMQVIRRQLFSPSPLGLLEFDKQQQIWRQKIAHRKGEFLKRLQVSMDDGKKLYTEDIGTLLYLADNDEEFNFAIKVIDRYKELQQKQSFQTHFPVGTHVLQMLYLYGKHDMAFRWFLDENYNVEISCRNRQCFMIMMDLLYEHGRYDNVVSLLTAADNYLDRKYPELINLVLASLYRMNTRESLENMLTVLNELCKDPIQLSNRCALLCAMLAYKQDEVELMLEIMQLPIFNTCSKKYITPVPNMKILAYIKLGRVEEAVDILKDAVIKYQKPIHLFFDEILEELDSAVKNSGNVELESLCQNIFRTFKVAGFVFDRSLDNYMLGVIRYKEYEMLVTTDNPVSMYSNLRTVGDRLATKDTKLIT